MAAPTIAPIISIKDVRKLPVEARGVWLSIRILMEQSPRRGYLLTEEGKPFTYESLQQTIAVNKAIICRSLAKLEAAGLIKHDESGYYDPQIVSEIPPSLKVAAKDQSSLRKHTGPGFLYAMVRDTDDAIKIGLSRNPKARLNTVQCYAAGKYRVRMLGTVAVGDMASEERKVHWTFRNWHLGNEWFAAPPELVINWLMSYRRAEKAAL